MVNNDRLVADILDWIKKRICRYSQSLTMSFGLLSFDICDSDKTESLGTDGLCLYINRAWLINSFKKDSEGTCGEILHVLCHCILLHPFVEDWEADFDNLQSFDSEKPLSDSDSNFDKEDQAWRLLEDILDQKTGSNPWRDDFYGLDDHSLWHKKPAQKDKLACNNGGPSSGQPRPGSSGIRQNTIRRWQDLFHQLRRTSWRRSAGGKKRQSLRESIRLTDSRLYDYRQFLRQFASLREEGCPNPDEFDYGFYNWSLDEYGDIPLIEPLEYREASKIEELVIAIDTSASCSREMVQTFLEETRNILSEDNLFFRRFRLHIIQCDNQIQRDDRITCREDFDRYLDDLRILGGGGTDFRPVFDRIEELRAKELYRLKGMIYFSDGCGIFPREMPDYTAAFVFIRHRYDDIDVPAWAQKLVLDAGRPSAMFTKN